MTEIVRITLDLETMSLQPDAAIVQIGACTIEQFGEEQLLFTRYINPNEAKLHGHVDIATMQWWDRQHPSVRAQVFGGTISSKAALADFEAWCKDLCGGDWENLRVYCKGPEFDWVVLRNAFEGVLGHWPFHYRSAQSSRTLLDLVALFGLPYTPQELEVPAKHDALEDAKWQANEAQVIFELLGPY